MLDPRRQVTRFGELLPISEIKNGSVGASTRLPLCPDQRTSQGAVIDINVGRCRREAPEGSLMISRAGRGASPGSLPYAEVGKP